MDASARVLLVGAGGIGCEVLKGLVLSGFRRVDVVDLDTIDLSNLNRQFLFARHHIKQPKALVARESALRFNPHVEITAHHANIKEPRFGVAYFRRFALVINALDNVDARRHVNLMCLFAGVPLVESGTAGYAGQVTVHVKDKTPCYECEPPATAQKTYPVCTIRNTPSTPIHCIVWAKSYLLSQLFGESPDDVFEDAGGDSKDIAKLKEEALALTKLRESISQPTFPKLVFEKVFHKDINDLLVMKDMWKARNPPTPLSFTELAKSAKRGGKRAELSAFDRDQTVWTLEKNFEVFCESLKKLASRLVTLQKTTPTATIEFDKDDDVALDFVTATANLRSHVYAIPPQSRFKIKEMAGNIIPAIATTNAIIAGVAVLVARKILKGKWSECKDVYTHSGKGASNFLYPRSIPPPNRWCGVCASNFATAVVGDFAATTLDALVKEVAKFMLAGGGDEDAFLSVMESGRLLYDSDFDGNANKTLADLNVHDGAILTIVAEFDEGGTVDALVAVSRGTKNDGVKVTAPAVFKKRVPPEPAREEKEAPKNAKRKADAVELVDAKKVRVAGADDDVVIL